MDRIIANRLWWYITSNKLINYNQMGFRKGKSTSDSTSIAFKNHLTIISLDFEKAYDKIGIHTVIDQLISWKLGPYIINYVINFMANRKFVVKKKHLPNI